MLPCFDREGLEEEAWAWREVERLLVEPEPDGEGDDGPACVSERISRLLFEYQSSTISVSLLIGMT